MPLHLLAHPRDVAVVRLGPDEVPTWDWSGGPLWSLTHSDSETSVICLADNIPDGLTREGPFRAVEVAGPLDFSLVGILAEILDPLVKAHISVLALGTYDTDWILVPSEQLDEATDVWRKAGLILTPATLTGGSP